ncbi:MULTISPECIES: GNAT family N-acetyltransferase [unclassified Streptomyces]|uniref:GNAT family N-acetyltransferase n=1 Tax=Streptomyces sp. NBC_01393 TaxID=2903851 RepID=A0AAU3I276_9ACTN|nr:GNAT family N-acetyltransferase [Streptomyces sp. NBC_00151]WRZ40769.1 GNAT family N-acetyltransferase [Streptomyces sp. NBC_00151]
MADLEIRAADADDVPAIVAMLADDPLGARRESPDDLSPYLDALERLRRDPNQHLVVAVRGGRVVGTLQLTVIPGLSRRGATRSVIEAVRIHADERGSGLGTELIEWAVAESRRQDCRLVQLTSDVSRTDAHRFYERLGFEASHVGFKLPL